MALMAVHGGQQFGVGDIVRVHQKIEEVSAKGKKKGSKTARIQAFEGMVIGIRGMGSNVMFTVRRIGSGKIGIERIFPLASPTLEKVDVVNRGAVRRAKLYYLRGKSAREIAEVTKKYARTKSAQAAIGEKKRVRGAKEVSRKKVSAKPDSAKDK